MDTIKKSGLSPKQRAFLAAYAMTGNISRAATIAKVSRSLHYKWLDEGGYRDEFGEAHEQACDSLEAEARRRATDGVDEPVFYKGEQCGAVRRYSDTLLIFLLKGALPEKYKDRIEQQIKKGKGILGGLSDDELEAIAGGGSGGVAAAEGR